MSTPVVQTSQIIVTAPPHQKKLPSTRIIMYEVTMALLPAVVGAVYYFGWNAAAIIAVCVASAVAAEAFIQGVMLKRPVTVSDGSAVLTGLLLALTLPPQVPLWLTAVGAIAAIGLGKMVFGGLGYNLFNPALIGRAFMMASQGLIMTTWVWPRTAASFLQKMNLDAVTTGTPLNLAKMSGIEYSIKELIWGNVAGSLGETCKVLLMLGAAYLIARKIIDWRIPCTFLLTVGVLAPLITDQSMVFHLFAGGLVLGAFYMATDYVTSPVTRKGKVIFGAGCGLLTIIIRRFGGYPEGVCYAILLMNAVSPLIDSFTRPRRFGEVKTCV
ncbi:MAG: RnfABCDGE type electron transport complex subunit D [Bacillota bacterium]